MEAEERGGNGAMQIRKWTPEEGEIFAMKSEQDLFFNEPPLAKHICSRDHPFCCALSVPFLVREFEVCKKKKWNAMHLSKCTRMLAQLECGRRRPVIFRVYSYSKIC